jgi:hypothetical protein
MPKLVIVYFLSFQNHFKNAFHFDTKEVEYCTIFSTQMLLRGIVWCPKTNKVDHLKKTSFDVFDIAVSFGHTAHNPVEATAVFQDF